MPSIAQVILNKYNGVADDVIAAVTPVVDNVKAAVHKATAPRQPIIMTESDLRNKEMLRNTLRRGSWMVDFTKMNGTEATMECTLDPTLIPYDPAKLNPVAPTTGAAAGAEHLLHVYALDRQGWRSFATPNVKKIYKKL